jgi:hypothetical protein
LPYVEQKRVYGEGEIRIGTNLDIGEDMWCLTYATMLKDEIIMNTINVETGDLIEEESSSDEEPEVLDEE